MASFDEMCEKIRSVDPEEIGFVGGEPLLCKDINEYIITFKDKIEYLTTNGIAIDALSDESIAALNGVNFSIHHYDPLKLSKHFGVDIDQKYFANIRNFVQRAKVIHPMMDIRIHCNLTKGYIDNYADFLKMIHLADILDIPRIHFAELQSVSQDEDLFVDTRMDVLFKVWWADSVLTQDPVGDGCFRHVACDWDTLNPIDVYIKQICPLTTNCKEFEMGAFRSALNVMDILHTRIVKGTSKLRVLYPDGTHAWHIRTTITTSKIYILPSERV
jgi:MoaA/NifB/PqqE/SkfB family radical SAM enzyme